MKTVKGIQAGTRKGKRACLPGDSVWQRRIRISGLAVCVLSVLSGATAEASLLVTSLDSRFGIDFENSVAGVNHGPFAGLGIATVPALGQLDADAWSVDGFSSPSDLSRGKSAGGVTTGGLYAFVTTPAGVPENIILGVQPTGGDFTPGSITLALQNLTGETVTKWEIDYQIHFLNNGSRSSALNFAFGTGGVFERIGALDFATPSARESGAAWSSVDRSTVIEAQVRHGEYLNLRWISNDLRGSGSRDEFGIDQIGVLAQRQNSAVPEPGCATLVLMLIGVGAGYRQRRRRRQITRQ